MTNKILLASNVSRGNLITPGYEQSYYVYFLPKVIEEGKVIYTDKLRLELVAPSSNGESVHKSYQMIDPSQEYLLILDLMKGYFFHQKTNGALNDYMVGSYLNKFIKDINKVIKDVREGVYDEGVM
jgi:hypothetical protein